MSEKSGLSNNSKAIMKDGLRELGCEVAKLFGKTIVTVAGNIQQSGQQKKEAIETNAVRH